MSLSISGIRAFRLALLLAWAPLHGLSAQELPPSATRAGLSFVASLGAAGGAGSGFWDLAVAGGVFVGRFDARVRYGGLIFTGACPAIFPSKCGDGDGGYFDGSVGLRFPDKTRRAGAWVLSASGGKADGRRTATLGLTFGRDQPIGGRWLFRVELWGRHLFDDSYEETWGSRLRQFGLRFGVGGWGPID